MNERNEPSTPDVIPASQKSGYFSLEADTLPTVRVALSAAILPDFLYRAVDKSYTISGIKALALKVKKRW